MSNEKNLNRRSFIKKGSLGLVGAGLVTTNCGADQEKDKKDISKELETIRSMKASKIETVLQDYLKASEKYIPKDDPPTRDKLEKAGQVSICLNEWLKAIHRVAAMAAYSEPLRKALLASLSDNSGKTCDQDHHVCRNS